MLWIKKASILSLVLLAGLQLAQTRAETIAVIGTGNVASALGPAFAGLGHDIVYGSRDPGRASVQELVTRTEGHARATEPADAVRGAAIVILAVPWDAAEQVVAGLGDLSGKVLLDPTNPRVIGPDGLRDYAFAGSNAERIQQWAPEARVVKAFNTMTADLMADPASAGGAVTVALAGDDPAAKAVVAELAEGIGFETLDFGPVRYAHVIEGMYLVWGNARRTGNPFEYFFRRPPD